MCCLREMMFSIIVHIIIKTKHVVQVIIEAKKKIIIKSEDVHVLFYMLSLLIINISYAYQIRKHAAVLHAYLENHEHEVRDWMIDQVSI